MGNRLLEFFYVTIAASFLLLVTELAPSCLDSMPSSPKPIPLSAYTLGECKKKKNSLKKPNKNETTLFNFFRLVLYRLIYGFASMFGGQEAISDFMGGILVPPGADEDVDADYRDYLDDYKGDGDYY